MKKQLQLKRQLARILAVLVSLPLFAGLGACSVRFSIGSSHPVSSSPVNAPKGWKKFTSKDLGYSAYFPGTPIRDTYEDRAGTYKRDAIVDSNENMVYAVSYGQFSASQDGDADALTDTQKKELLLKFARLIGVKDEKLNYTTIDGHMSFVYTTTAEENAAIKIYRGIVLGKHGFYALDVFGVSEADAKTFRDTFRIL